MKSESTSARTPLEQTPLPVTWVGMVKRHIPNAITLANLFFGCCAVLSVFTGHFVTTFWFFIASVVADYLDGTVARLLGVHSALGKELDSLADVVSFGVLPGSIYYVLLVRGWTGDARSAELNWLAAPGFLVTLFSALRLAKFNLDERQADYFIGLPTPSGALFTVGLLLIFQFDSYGLGQWVTLPAFLYLCIGLLSTVLVAELPMFSLKFKHYAWKGNEIKFIFAAAAFLLLFLLREIALSLIILLYVVVSVILKMLNRPPV